MDEDYVFPVFTANTTLGIFCFLSKFLFKTGNISNNCPVYTSRSLKIYSTEASAILLCLLVTASKGSTRFSMATHIYILACKGMFLTCLILNSSSVSSLEYSNCTFPPGSVACKVWNYTNMDCAWRELFCVPTLHHKASLKSLDLSHNKFKALHDNAFTGFTKLQTLDLSFNSISTLPDNAFSGLHNLLMLNISSNGIWSIEKSTFSRSLSKLKTLDLSWNDGFNISNGSPFQDLSSLQTLDLYSSLHGLDITASTFTGLSNLQSLSVKVGSTSPTPFSHLSGLRYMQLELYTCDYKDELFTGLVNLEYINVTDGGTDSYFSASDFTLICAGTIDICPLISLQSLKILFGGVSMNKPCLQMIPLKMLHIAYEENVRHVLPFEMLKNLTNLTLMINVLDKFDINSESLDSHIQRLNSLQSPLQNLSLNDGDSFCAITLTSTTFESWPKWKESLKVLKIICTDIVLEGSPFKWFPKLRVLHLSDTRSVETSFDAISNITFEGLGSLEELHLPNSWFEDYNIGLSNALPIFGKYNSLKVLNLAQIPDLDFYSIAHGICSVLSLEKVDLSFSAMIDSLQFECTLPNLEILETESVTESLMYTDLWIHLDDICFKAPNMTMLNAKSSNCKMVKQFACPNLVIAYLSKSRMIFSNTSIIVVPHLEELYLNEITINSRSLTNLKIVNNFKTSKLRILDLSSNRIAVIDREDSLLFSNVTYLDLSNNTLTSLSSLLHIRKIQVLLLGRNKIGFVPELLLGIKMNTFDMCDNVLQCDCNVIEAFRDWILTNKLVFLTSNCTAFDPNGMQYRCLSPDARKGFSITEIYLDCDSPLVKIISISITCVLLVAVATVLIVRYYWHIRYRLFLLFNRRVYQNNRVHDDDDDNNDDDENGMPRYDAYVTYHREDEDWVDEELLPNIEEGEEPFRLCLRTRDIRAGKPVFSEMSLRIQRSRKILVILSPRFVNDNWCYFELNMAHHRVLEENSNVLIFIMLQKVPDNKLTLLLRQLFCRAQIFKYPADEYGRRLFWQRVREELKRPVPLDRRFNI